MRRGTVGLLAGFSRYSAARTETISMCALYEMFPPLHSMAAILRHGSLDGFRETILRNCGLHCGLNAGLSYSAEGETVEGS